MKTYNYKISPSLLDKFQKVCDAAETFEDFVNIDTEGNYRRSFDEIAQTLGISPDSARMQLSRARKAVRECYRQRTLND